MANTFLTQKQLMENIMDSARKAAAGMSVGSLKRLVEMDTFRGGISGGLLVALVIAAKERLRAMEDTSPCA
jgi:hypothetical protein